MQKPEVYAMELKGKLGHTTALAIAERCMKATDPKEAMNLPVGTVFFHKDKHNRWTPNDRSSFFFWKHVFHILKKR